MVLIQLMGGLGNQLFQYALYCKLESLGKNVKIDDFSWFHITKSKGIKLQDLDIEYKKATLEEIKEYEDNFPDFMSRVRRKVFGRKAKVYDEVALEFDSKVFEIDDVCLVGYWQTEKYFSDIRNTLLDKIQLATDLNQENQEMLLRIQNTNSVSVHIRKGDYDWPEFRDRFGGICTELYYADAIEYVRSQLKEPQFYVFTNDKEWAKMHFQGEEFVVVDLNDDRKGYLDMYLMSNCKHNIIANSSFSWWGAWMNKNMQKIVVAPDKWINKENQEDIYCTGWYRILEKKSNLENGRD